MKRPISLSSRRCALALTEAVSAVIRCQESRSKSLKTVTEGSELSVSDASEISQKTAIACFTQSSEYRRILDLCPAHVTHFIMQVPPNAEQGLEGVRSVSPSTRPPVSQPTIGNQRRN